MQEPPSEHVEPFMLEPIERAGTAGYVPLCVALHWIMTSGGVTRVRAGLGDRDGRAQDRAVVCGLR
jgi:hypothetical protein